MRTSTLLLPIILVALVFTSHVLAQDPLLDQSMLTTSKVDDSEDPFAKAAQGFKKAQQDAKYKKGEHGVEPSNTRYNTLKVQENGDNKVDLKDEKVKSDEQDRDAIENSDVSTKDEKRTRVKKLTDNGDVKTNDIKPKPVKLAGDKGQDEDEKMEKKGKKHHRKGKNGKKGSKGKKGKGKQERKGDMKDKRDQDNKEDTKSKGDEKEMDGN